MNFSSLWSIKSSAPPNFLPTDKFSRSAAIYFGVTHLRFEQQLPIKKPLIIISGFDGSTLLPGFYPARILALERTSMYLFTSIFIILIISVDFNMSLDQVSYPVQCETHRSGFAFTKRASLYFVSARGVLTSV